jgi:cyclopropane fatty-acyl-phospholipid synthase-like methyltransferase
MADLNTRLQAILERCEHRVISPAVALMELLIETEDAAAVTAALPDAAATPWSVREIRALQEANAAGCARVAAMLRSHMDRPPKGASIEEGVAFCKRLFDWSVRQSEEASVALYSLGNAELLLAATREIVAVLDGWGSLGPEKRALDIGCGIGRMEEALATKLGEIHAIDVSQEMIAVARQRCEGLPHVILSTCTGLDLHEFKTDAFDLVFAIDSFPYLVQSGMPLVGIHFAEAMRILRPGGEFVVLNFSYRDDLSIDCADVDSLARSYGFDVLVAGETPFTLWNGAAFRLRKSHG